MEHDLSATAAVLDGKETAAGLRAKAPTGGLTVERFFTTPGVDPADELAWEMRTASISAEERVSIMEEALAAQPSQQ